MIPLSRPHPKARYVVPEVVQTSMMDCGPAALLALVSGFGMAVNYGRLREACQTSVDGTSITMMDEIANLLGLDTEEMMLPADHLLLPEAHALPAIVVVKTPNGSNHFVVLWSTAGPWVQVMDPAEGRHWMLRSVLFERLYIHQAKVPASAWRTWAGEQEFLSVLDVRLAALGIDRPDRERLCATALASPYWAPMAALDAATRMTAALVENRAVSPGALCLTLIERQLQPRDDGGYPLIAGEYRSVWRAPVQDDGEEALIVRGVVLVRALGLRDGRRRIRDIVIPEGAADGRTVQGTAEDAAAASAHAAATQPGDPAAASASNGAAVAGNGAAARTRIAAVTAGAIAKPVAANDADAETAGDAGTATDADAAAATEAGAETEAEAEPVVLPPELAAALTAESIRPWRTLVGMLAEDGLLTPLVLGMVLVLSAALITVDAILLRGLLEVGQQLGLPSQRAAAMAGLVGFLALGLFVELPLIAGALRLGRALDLRLRMAFLAKIPRLDDRYFRSRLLSDMAERGHSLHLVRSLPRLGVRLLAASAQLLLTVGGIAWLQPESALFALVAAVFCIGVPLACQPLMAERDLRLRSHAGALGRFYLDALIGLLPIRVHGARGAMQHQQESLLVSWARAGLRYYAAATLVEGVLALCGLGMAVLMVWSVSSQSSAGLLLLVYWALSLPALGQDIAIVARQYPVMRNVVSRLLEPLGTPEPIEPVSPPGEARVEAAASRGAAIRMAGVSVEAAGNTVLEQVDLELAPGEHVAIVGPSGAGKSTLVGLLLGWYRPAAGSVEVDGRPLVGDWLRSLRGVTAWVDPAIALWNRSFLDNIRYGADDSELPLAEILSRARLREVLEHLPDGLTTELGEGGALISGGEGQRTRVGRALARRHARLIVLDEPFRGLDLTTRRELLAMARAWWRDATLLWVTHDIAETEQFDRVLVIDNGRIVEDGDPAALNQQPGSRYASLVRGDREMHEREWSGERWRRVWIDRGKVREELSS